MARCVAWSVSSTARARVGEAGRRRSVAGVRRRLLGGRHPAPSIERSCSGRGYRDGRRTPTRIRTARRTNVRFVLIVIARAGTLAVLLLTRGEPPCWSASSPSPSPSMPSTEHRVYPPCQCEILDSCKTVVPSRRVGRQDWMMGCRESLACWSGFDRHGLRCPPRRWESYRLGAGSRAANCRGCPRRSRRS